MNSMRMSRSLRRVENLELSGRANRPYALWPAMVGVDVWEEYAVGSQCALKQDVKSREMSRCSERQTCPFPIEKSK